MPTNLHIIDPPQDEPLRSWTYSNDPGAMWRWPDLDRDGREAWCIVLPNMAGLWWTTYLADKTDPPKMWEVSGTPPNITVHPSIDAGSRWHGWIKDGVMTP